MRAVKRMAKGKKKLRILMPHQVWCGRTSQVVRGHHTLYLNSLTAGKKVWAYCSKSFSKILNGAGAPFLLLVIELCNRLVWAHRSKFSIFFIGADAPNSLPKVDGNGPNNYFSWLAW